MRAEPRLPELDGLRGVAIVLVMLTHFTILDGKDPWDYPFQALRSFSWIGVDLFFGLSGFLITGILLATREDAGALKSFYGRRLLRILPVYYFLLALYTWVLPALFPEGSRFFPAVWITRPLWYWTFLSNFYFVHLGHFPSEVMAVSWSLAIEEQFYLVWPWIVRLCSDRKLEIVCFLAFVGTSVLRLILIASKWDSVSLYVFTPVRLESLFVGGLVALWRRTPEGTARLLRWRRPAFWLGLGLLCGSFAADCAVQWQDEQDLWLALISFPAFALFFGGALAYILDENTSWKKAFTHPALRSVGQWSFPIYLLNNTFSAGVARAALDPNTFSGGRARWTAQILFYGALFPLCTAAGALLHFGLELPFQRLKTRLPRSPSPFRLQVTGENAR